MCTARLLLVLFVIDRGPTLLVHTNGQAIVLGPLTVASPPNQTLPEFVLSCPHARTPSFHSCFASQIVSLP